MFTLEPTLGKGEKHRTRQRQPRGRPFWRPYTVALPPQSGEGAAILILKRSSTDPRPSSANEPNAKKQTPDPAMRGKHLAVRGERLAQPYQIQRTLDPDHPNHATHPTTYSQWDQCRAEQPGESGQGGATPQPLPAQQAPGGGEQSTSKKARAQRGQTTCPNTAHEGRNSNT